MDWDGRPTDSVFTGDRSTGRLSLGRSRLSGYEDHQVHSRRSNEHETQSSCMGRFDRGIGRAFELSGLLAADAGGAQGHRGGPADGQGLIQAFGAVAEFARPSVVQISVQKKTGKGMPRTCADSRFPIPRGNARQPRRSRPGPRRNAAEVLQSGIGPAEGAVRLPEPGASGRASSTTTRVTS